MKLVILVGEDKESWGQISGLINNFDECNKIIVVQNKSVVDFPIPEKSEIVKMDSDSPLFDMKEKLLERFKKIFLDDFEVALSIASGNGKEHMAVLSALLSVPVGVRLTVFTKEGVKFLT